MQNEPQAKKPCINCFWSQRCRTQGAGSTGLTQDPERMDEKKTQPFFEDYINNEIQAPRMNNIDGIYREDFLFKSNGIISNHNA